MTSSGNYSIPTRHSNDLHLAQTDFAIYQKGVYYTGVKIFTILPSNIKNTSGKLKRLKRILKHCLIIHNLSTLWRNIILDDTCGR